MCERLRTHLRRGTLPGSCLWHTSGRERVGRGRGANVVWAEMAGFLGKGHLKCVAYSVHFTKSSIVDIV
jgi:hypothetical protein